MTADRTGELSNRFQLLTRPGGHFEHYNRYYIEHLKRTNRKLNIITLVWMKSMCVCDLLNMKRKARLKRQAVINGRIWW